MWHYLQDKFELLFVLYKDNSQCSLYRHKCSLTLPQETGVEIDATAPSTTAGPGFEDVPEALELAAAEFLWAWEGMRVEARDGFTDNSVRGDKKTW